MTIVVTREAQRDLQDCFVFYDQQDSGVGEVFLSEIREHLRALRDCAGIHAKRFGKHRMLVGRFPHAIYYDVTGERVIVQAVADCRMDPGRIEVRVRQDDL